MILLSNKKSEKNEELFATLLEIIDNVNYFCLDDEITEGNLCDELALDRAEISADEWCHGFIRNDEQWNVAELDVNTNVFILNGQKKCKVHFYEPYLERKVRSMEWFLQDGKHFKTDYYTRDGFKLSTGYFAQNREIEKVYYSEKNTESFRLLRDQKQVVLYNRGRVCDIVNYPFEFLQKMHMSDFEDDTIVITDVIILEEYLNWNPNGRFKAIAFSYEEALLMVQILKQMYISGSVYCLTKMPSEQKQLGIQQLAVLSDGNDLQKINKSIFIMTDTDRIEGIEYFVENLKEFDFHIGANTAMSNRLMSLSENGNVYLYPGTTDEKYNELLQNCSLYLDINYFSEIRNAVEEAFLHDMVILGFENTIHDSRYIVEECVYNQSNIEKMTDDIRELISDESKFESIIDKQRKAAKCFWDGFDEE